MKEKQFFSLGSVFASRTRISMWFELLCMHLREFLRTNNVYVNGIFAALGTRFL